MITLNKVYKKDYLKLLKEIDDNSIDFICIDPPYGKIQGMKLSGQKTKIEWDDIIDWEVMFKEFNRITKPGGTMAVFGQQPTYSKMVLSNVQYYKYEYIWEKNNAAQGFHAKRMPLNFSENIAVFIKDGGERTFNKPNNYKEVDKNEHWTRWYAQKISNYINLPRRQVHKQMENRSLEFFLYFTGTHFGIPSKENYDKLTKLFKLKKMDGYISYELLKENWKDEREDNKGVKLESSVYNGTYSNILKISKDYKPYLHPTQKPLKLMELLVKVHSNEGDIVLDCFAGSGSTLVAAKKLNRNFIGSELSHEFALITEERLKKIST